MTKEKLTARLTELQEAKVYLEKRYYIIDGATQEIQRLLEELSKEETKE